MTGETALPLRGGRPPRLGISGLVHFPPQETQIMLSTGERRRVIVGADALLFWWGADSGPQTAEGLVEEHLHEIATAVSAKLGRGFKPRSGAVRIGEEDLD